MKIGAQLKSKLETQLRVMQQQQDYISNLQKANRNLKEKVRTLQEVSQNASAAQVQESHAADRSFQEMELVSCGTIEKITRGQAANADMMKPQYQRYGLQRDELSREMPGSENRHPDRPPQPAKKQYQRGGLGRGRDNHCQRDDFDRSLP